MNDFLGDHCGDLFDVSDHVWERGGFAKALHKAVISKDVWSTAATGIYCAIVAQPIGLIPWFIASDIRSAVRAEVDSPDV